MLLELLLVQMAWPEIHKVQTLSQKRFCVYHYPHIPPASTPNIGRMSKTSSYRINDQMSHQKRALDENCNIICLGDLNINFMANIPTDITAGNPHKQNSRFCKEICEDNFRFWWRRVHEDASQGMYMSKIEIFFFTAWILHNQRMLCCGECFHD